MGTVNARRLDDEVVGRLKRRADESNRSLESEARHILEQAAQDDMAEKVRAFRALASGLSKQPWDQPQTPSHILIREDRDSGHEIV